MNGNYSEALEQQLALMRRLSQWSGRRGATEKNAELLLKSAEAYYVPSDIGQMLYGAAQSLPEWPLSKTDLPAPRGFAWFENPPFELVNDIGGGHRMNGDTCALLWGDGVVRTQDEGVVQGVCIQVIGRLAGVVLPWFETTWRYGESYANAVERLRIPRTERYDAIVPSQDEGICIEEAMRLIASLWLFTQQTILITNRELLDRHARKRLAKVGYPEPTVRVVQLRRPEHSAGTTATAHVEWSCQWIVRGHWRQQFYRSKHENRPIWITPYVKGPDDKPLKTPRATVFAVVR